MFASMTSDPSFSTISFLYLSRGISVRDAHKELSRAIYLPLIRFATRNARSSSCKRLGNVSRHADSLLYFSPPSSDANDDVIYCFRALTRFPDFRERFVTLVLLMAVGDYLNSHAHEPGIQSDDVICRKKRIFRERCFSDSLSWLE